MTNEQLAILLEGYAEKLKSIYSEIDKSLPESAEREMRVEWIGEGHSPPLGYFFAKTDDPNWKKTPTGYAFCLNPLREEIERICIDIRCLFNREEQP